MSRGKKIAATVAVLLASLVGASAAAGSMAPSATMAERLCC